MPMPSYADRDVQFPMRFKFTKVQGIEDQYDLTPVPGTITNAGTQLNKSFFDAVKAAIEEMAVADGGITTAKLANGAVTAAKLAANAVTITGTYTGTGGTQTINLAQTPKVILIQGDSMRSSSTGYDNIMLLNIKDMFCFELIFDGNESGVLPPVLVSTSVDIENNSIKVKSHANVNGATYKYIAII